MEIYITMSTTLGISKVFILDKYFNELQKFWDTEKRLQGKNLLLKTNGCHIKVIKIALIDICKKINDIP